MSIIIIIEYCLCNRPGYVVEGDKAFLIRFHISFIYIDRGTIIIIVYLPNLTSILRLGNIIQHPDSCSFMLLFLCILGMCVEEEDHLFSLHSKIT